MTGDISGSQDSILPPIQCYEQVTSIATHLAAKAKTPQSSLISTVFIRLIVFSFQPNFLINTSVITQFELVSIIRPQRLKHCETPAKRTQIAVDFS